MQDIIKQCHAEGIGDTKGIAKSTADISCCSSLDHFYFINVMFSVGIVGKHTPGLVRQG